VSRPRVPSPVSSREVRSRRWLRAAIPRPEIRGAIGTAQELLSNHALSITYRSPVPRLFDPPSAARGLLESNSQAELRHAPGTRTNDTDARDGLETDSGPLTRFSTGLSAPGVSLLLPRSALEVRGRAPNRARYPSIYLCPARRYAALRVGPHRGHPRPSALPAGRRARTAGLQARSERVCHLRRETAPYLTQKSTIAPSLRPSYVGAGLGPHSFLE
jgi:hypothetical protein